MSNNPYSSECEWGVGRSGATGLYLGGELAGAERLACIWVDSWQERSDWLVFGPPQAGSICESCQVWPASGGLEFRVLLTSACLRQARFLQIVLKNWFL